MYYGYVSIYYLSLLNLCYCVAPLYHFDSWSSCSHVNVVFITSVSLSFFLLLRCSFIHRPAVIFAHTTDCAQVDVGTPVISSAAVASVSASSPQGLQVSASSNSPSSPVGVPAVGAAASDAQPGSVTDAHPGSVTDAEVTYGSYLRTSDDGLLSVEGPRSPNGTGESGFIDDEAGMRYAFSFTLTSIISGHTDVSFQWFEKLGQFAHIFCHRAAIGLERGGVRRVLHVQAVLVIGLDYRGDTTKIASSLREKIRKLCGLVGAKITIKELAPTQTFARKALLWYLSLSFCLPTHFSLKF